MGTNVGDVFVSMLVDNESAFKGQVSKVAVDAGTAAGQALGGSLTSALTSARSLLTGALNTFFSATVGHVQQLERAVAEFSKTTGVMGKEAERAGRAINDMASRNLQPIAQIGKTLEVIYKDWRLTGEAADAAAERVLRYAQATGQDAVSAASTFDTIQDRLNLTAEEGAEIMDALIANTQKYGGSVSEQQAALTNLIPTLQAANMTWQDGLSILGYFEGVGISSSAAVTGLMRAVRQLKPGQNIQDLFDQISAIDDAGARATKATSLFGRGVAVQLAQALAKGKVDLKSFILTEQEYTGATDRAREASLTWGDRFAIAMRSIVSTVTSLLGPAGPLMQAFAGFTQVFGPALQHAVSGGFSFAKSAISNIMSNAGSEMAGEMSAGFIAELSASTIAEGAAGTIGGNLTAEGILRRFDAMGKTAGQAASAGVATGLAAGMAGTAGAGAIVKAADAVSGTLLTSVKKGADIAGDTAGKALAESLGYRFEADAIGRMRWVNVNGQVVKMATLTGEMAGAVQANAMLEAQAAQAATLSGRFAALWARIGAAASAAFAGAMRIGMLVLANPVTWLVAIGAGILALARDPKLREQVFELARGIVNFLVEGIRGLGDFFVDIGGAIVDFIVEGVRGLGELIANAVAPEVAKGASEGLERAGAEVASSDRFTKAVEAGFKGVPKGVFDRVWADLMEASGGDEARVQRMWDQIFDPARAHKAIKFLGDDAGKYLAEVSDNWHGVMRESMALYLYQMDRLRQEEAARQGQAGRLAVMNNQRLLAEQAAAATSTVRLSQQSLQEWVNAYVESGKAADAALEQNVYAQKGVPRRIAEAWAKESPTLEEAARFMMTGAADGVERGFREGIIRQVPELWAQWNEQGRKALEGGLSKLGSTFAETFKNVGKAAGDAAQVVIATTQKEEAATEKFNSALETVANLSYPDIADAAYATQKAIDAAMSGKSVRFLRGEMELLQHQQKRYREQGEWDALAIVEARMKEVRAALAARETYIEGAKESRAQAAAKVRELERIQKELGVSRDKAKELYNWANRDPKMVISVATTAIDVAIQKMRNLLALLGQPGPTIDRVEGGSELGGTDARGSEVDAERRSQNDHRRALQRQRDLDRVRDSLRSHAEAEREDAAASGGGDGGGGDGKTKREKQAEREEKALERARKARERWQEALSGAAATAEAQATDALALSTDRATAATEKWADALAFVSGTSWPELQAASEDRLRKLRESLDAQVDPIKTLQDETAQLSVMREEAAAKERWDVVTSIDIRLKEIEVEQQQLAMVKERYAAQGAMNESLEEENDKLAALRASLEAQLNPMKMLRDEMDALRALREEAAAKERWDIVAATELRLQELAVQREQLRTVAERYASESSAADMLHRKMDISIEKAARLIAIWGEKKKYEGMSDKELVAVIMRELEGRASGGRVEEGQAYWVGENRRRELFVPDESGTVLTEAQAKWGGTLTMGSNIGGLLSRLGTMFQSAVVEHKHTVSLEGARNLAAAGFDTEALANLLRSSTQQPRYGWGG